MGFYAIRPRFDAFSTRLRNKFIFPERFKNTVIERWVFYWKNLFSDYAEVGVNLVQGARAKPKKAAVYLSVMYAGYTCCKRNPDEEDFQQVLRRYHNSMAQVPSGLQNPVSSEYLRKMEQANNHNTLRFLSLGVLTFLWIDLKGKDMGDDEDSVVNYKNFHERIVDVGFWNRWWRLDWNMRNYDVNYL